MTSKNDIDATFVIDTIPATLSLEVAMARVVLVLILLGCALGCTAKEARHDGDVFLDDAGKTADFLMNPPQAQPW
jgi:hypothetical protein